MSMRKFRLLPEWRKVLRRARSVKWGIASGLLGLIETLVPLSDGIIPHGYFAAASCLAAFAVPIARVAIQQGMGDDEKS